MRKCIDFRNLSLATLKDEYLMTMADMLINFTADNKIISFINDHSSSNKIFIVSEEIFKMILDVLVH